MSRFAAGLVLCLVLAPLAHADLTRYVDNQAGPGGDFADSLHGRSSDLPWKSLSFAMTRLPQPNTTNGNVFLIIRGNYTNNININPVNTPINGKEYFFIGDTTNPYAVTIDPPNANTNTTLCSTYVNIKGVWFKDGLTMTATLRDTIVKDVPAIHADSLALSNPDFRHLHTKRRLFSTARKCVFGDSDQAMSVRAIALEASNVFVGDSRAINGGVGGSRYGGGTLTGGLAGRFRTVGIEINGVTADWDKNEVFAEHLVSFGTTYDDGCDGHCPEKSIFTDSLKVWFCKFRASICSTCDKHTVTFFHCTNLSLRGNHWNLGTKKLGGDQRIFSVRDSMDNPRFDRDTLIVTDNNNSTVRMLIGYNTIRSGNDRAHWVVDSCYWQVPIMEWRYSLSGTFTYTTFVGRRGLTFVDDTDQVDSLQTNTFNHNTIVGTSDASFPIISLSSLDKQANSTTTYGWPSTITNGNVLHFKNNLLFRAKSWGRGTCYNNDPFPVMTFGDCFNTANPKRDNSLRMTLANNLYVTDDYIWNPGDISMGWRARHLSDTCSSTGYRRSSRPGDVGAFGFKALADNSASQAVGGPQGYAAAAASNYDSLGTYCNRDDIQFEEWFDSNGAGTNFERVWVTGELLDLNIPYTSFARGRGESGTDVGAASVRASPLITFVNNDTVVAVTDDGPDAHEDQVVIRNDGNADLNPIITVEPLGQYFAVVPIGTDNGFPLAPAASVTLNITLVDPSFALPVGTYYLDVVITHSAGSAGTVGRRIRYNISRSVYSIDE